MALADAYAGLERRVHAEVAKMSRGICAVCAEPCCRSGHCRDALSSSWLRLIASRLGCVGLEGAGQDISFLSDFGCTLAAGRPMQCTYYICDDLSIQLRQPVDMFAYRVLTGALAYVARNVSGGTDLTEIEDPYSLTVKQVEKVTLRIRAMHRCIDAALDVRSCRHEAKQVEETAEKILFITRALPFAAAALRFDGEPPNVSRKRSARSSVE